MPSFKTLDFLTLEKILKVFATYGRGCHFGHVTWTIYAIFLSPFLWRLEMNFDYDWLSGVGEKDTVKPVLATTHSVDMEIATDRRLLIAKWKQSRKLHYFHAAINNQ